MLKNRFVKYHLLPICIASIALLCFSIYAKKTSVEPTIISKNHSFELERGAQRITDVSDSLSKEVFIDAFTDKNTFVILGSSELSSGSPYNPFKYLNDSIGINTCAIGQGYHQSFSVLCRLLAMEPHLKNKQICIFLSPGWFGENGTNTEAFFQSMDLDLLTQIYFNKNIDSKFKLAIGNYLSKNQSEIKGSAPILNKFILDYQEHSDNKNPFTKAKATIENPIINRFHSKYSIKNYQVNQSQKPALKPVKNWNISSLKNKFIEDCNNEIYVDSAYFVNHLLLEDGSVREGGIALPEYENNVELEDLKLLLAFLKKKEVKVTFVMQPMNPYFYKNTEVYLPILDEIEKMMQAYNFPYLDLYPRSKESYEPGTLTDVMHMGDYGWMQINRFILEHYEK